jgi:hypothetical protein
MTYNRRDARHCWAWYYRLTIAYIALMVTLVALLVYKGAL